MCTKLVFCQVDGVVNYIIWPLVLEPMRAVRVLYIPGAICNLVLMAFAPKRFSAQGISFYRLLM